MIWTRIRALEEEDFRLLQGTPLMETLQRNKLVVSVSNDYKTPEFENDLRLNADTTGVYYVRVFKYRGEDGNHFNFEILLKKKRIWSGLKEI